MITNPAFFSGKFILILSFVLLATSAEVSARHPRPRVANGSIVSIDWTTRTLRIKNDTDPGTLTLVWNDRTLFTAGNRKSSAAELARRKPVTVWYYTPWIGEQFASRIILRKDGSLPLRR